MTSDLEATVTSNVDLISDLEATVTRNVDLVSKFNVSFADIPDVSSVAKTVASLSKLQDTVSNVPDPLIIYFGVACGVVGLLLGSVALVVSMRARSNGPVQNYEPEKQTSTAVALEASV